MAKRALGMVETLGLVGAIEAADAASKSASIEMVEIEYSDAGLCTVKVLGEVADVLSAVDAGSNAAKRVGQLVARHVIPQPADDTEKLIVHKPVYSDATGSHDVMSEGTSRKPSQAGKGKGKKK